MVRILLMLLGLLATACFVLWLQVGSLTEATAQLTADKVELADDILKYQSTIESKEATISGLQKDLSLREQIAIDKQQQTILLQSKLNQTKGELAQLSKSDDTVKDWAIQLVPVAVSRLLSKASSSNKN